MSEIKNIKQEILTGSARLIKEDKKPFDRVQYMMENMHFNKAYLSIAPDEPKKKK